MHSSRPDRDRLELACRPKAGGRSWLGALRGPFVHRQGMDRPARLAIVAAAALIATPSHADSFRHREIAFQLFNAVDGVQTCHVIGSGKGYELNPLLGRSPSCPKVLAVKASGGLLHWLISDALRDRDPVVARVFQFVSMAVQGGVISWNLKAVF